MKPMKQYMLLLLAIFFGCVACDDSNNEINIQPEATGSYTDVRDGNEYHWVICRFGVDDRKLEVYSRRGCFRT